MCSILKACLNCFVRESNYKGAKRSRAQNNIELLCNNINCKKGDGRIKSFSLLFFFYS